MKKQLNFRFCDKFAEQRLDNLTEAEKEAIRLALKEMMVAYFERKHRLISRSQEQK